MKAFFLVTLLVSATVTADSFFDHQGDDIQADANFIQLQEIEKLVLQPTETYRVNLEQIFRGQNLDFTWQVTYADTGLPVPNQISPKDNPLVQITPPYRETFSQSLFSQGSTDQMSLPQTTLIYMDAYQNRYMILIDYMMQLKIYDISQFYLDDIPPIVPLTVDLYQKGQGQVHEDRACNNLIQLDDNLLFAICKSSLSTPRSSIGLSVYVRIILSLISIDKPRQYNGINSLNWGRIRIKRVEL